MANSQYRWFLTPSGETGDYVTPIHSKKELVGKIVTDEQFIRYTWDEPLTFLKADYDFIYDTDFDTKFTLRMEEWIDAEATYVPFQFQFEFSKIDCEFDEDRKTIKVKPTLIDDYKKIIDNWDRQYDVIRNNPGTQSVKIQVDPIYQFYFPGSEYVTNSLRSTYWEQRVQSVVYSEDELVNDYHFKKVRDVIYIPGDGAGLSPDISGYFTPDLATNHYQNGDYQIRVLAIKTEFSVNDSVLDDSDYASIWQDTSGNQFAYFGREGNRLYFNGLDTDEPDGSTLTHVSGATNTGAITFYSATNQTGIIFIRYYIYDSVGAETVWLGEINRTIAGEKVSNSLWIQLLLAGGLFRSFNAPAYRKGLVFTSRSTGDRCKAFHIQQFARIATPLESITINGPFANFTFELTQDILPLNANYNRVYPFNAYVVFSDLNDPADQGYGKFAADAINFANQYFVKPPESGLIDGVFPVHQSEWLEYSMWFITNTQNNILKNTKDLTLKDAYSVTDTLSYLLSQIDPNISHTATIECSDFLYNLSGNEVRGDYRPIWITPKSNIINGNYDSPARKGEVSIGEMLNLFKRAYKCYWFIENGKLKIEHISFFKKGKTYLTTPITSTDLTVQVHSQNELPYAFSTKHYTFMKEEIPKLITFQWMDEVSEFFQGYDIELISNYVDEDNIEDIRIDKFTTDVNYVLINSESINTDGFMLLETMTDINGDQRVPYINITLLDNMYELQNGYLSFLYLHNTVWLHDLPTKRAIVNKVEKEAISIRLTKLQKPFKHPDIEIDDLQLVSTSLGVGKIYSRKRNLKYQTQEIELIYEPE